MAPSEESRTRFFRGKKAVSLLRDWDITRNPRHVAVIMDGNGRWAAKRGLPVIAGHTAGTEGVREIIAASIELGIEYLTVYSFSAENWSRPEDEVSGLMSLFVKVLQKELANLREKDVRVLVIGDMEPLPRQTREAFEQVIADTRQNGGLTFVVALNYGARQEITRAVRSIAEDVCANRLQPAEIGEETIAERLYTAEIPDPDLLIRTSGEQRISNFLLWQIAYTEIIIDPALWPDFDRTHFLRAIVEYQSRQRRFGGR
ncbi:MAG: isoprenyl transferase [Coriobacteriia bacterium]